MLNKILAHRLSIKRLQSTAAALVIFAVPSFAETKLNNRDYLPAVMQHLDRAQLALDSAQYSVAVANVQVIVHDEGLKVYVDMSLVLASQTQACRLAVDKAVLYWNGTLNVPNLLIVVSESSKADVKVMFQATVVLEGIQVGGYCSSTRSIAATSLGKATAKFEATIYARFLQPNQTLMTADQLTSVVTHEFGHIFGLNDTTQSGRLMGALNLSSPHLALSSEELKALQLLRNAAFAIRDKSRAQAK